MGYVAEFLSQICIVLRVLYIIVSLMYSWFGCSCPVVLFSCSFQMKKLKLKTIQVILNQPSIRYDLLRYLTLVRLRFCCWLNNGGPWPNKRFTKTINRTSYKLAISSFYLMLSTLILVSAEHTTIQLNSYY